MNEQKTRDAFVTVAQKTREIMCGMTIDRIDSE